VNPHEVEYLAPSAAVADAISAGRLGELLAILFEPRKHPFVTVLLAGLTETALRPLGLDTLQALRALYFLCTAAVLVAGSGILRAWQGRVSAVSQAALAMLALSCPFVLQCLFAGETPEDLVAMALLFGALWAHAGLRGAWLAQARGRAMGLAAALGALLWLCTWCRYNVGMALSAALALELVLWAWSSPERRRLLWWWPGAAVFALLTLPTAALQLQHSWNAAEVVAGQVGITGGGLEPLLYAKLLVTNSAPFEFAEDGVWVRKGHFAVRYFTHWGQGLLALAALAAASALALHRGRPVAWLVPTAFVWIHLIFFALTTYKRVEAMLPVVPVLWLLAALLLGGRREDAGRRPRWQWALAGLALAYLLGCAGAQLGATAQQLGRFLAVHDLDAISASSNREVDLAITLAEEVDADAWIAARTSDDDIGFAEFHLLSLLRQRVGEVMSPRDLDEYPDGAEITVLRTTSSVSGDAVGLSVDSLGHRVRVDDGDSSILRLEERILAGGWSQVELERMERVTTVDVKYFLVEARQPGAAWCVEPNGGMAWTRVRDRGGEASAAEDTVGFERTEQGWRIAARAGPPRSEDAHGCRGTPRTSLTDPHGRHWHASGAALCGTGIDGETTCHQAGDSPLGKDPIAAIAWDARGGRLLIAAGDRLLTLRPPERAAEPAP